MNCTISTDSSISVAADWLVVLLTDSQPLTSPIQDIDSGTSGTISSLFESEQFCGKALETLILPRCAGVNAKNLVLAGLGEVQTCSVRKLRHSLLAALRLCCCKANQTVAVVVEDSVVSLLSLATVAEVFADAAEVAATDTDIYKNKRARSAFASAMLCLPQTSDDALAALSRGSITGQSCVIVKDLVNRTANDIYPETFADEAANLAKQFGLEVTVLDEKQLEAERMGALLAVAQGSSRPARMVKLAWNGAGKEGEQIALVGKGVTFDTGGYSIKPSDSMISMKSDMAGAATALGAIVAAARLKLPVNVSAYLGLAENMISGNAYRLGDVLTARNGTTIEIHNTDAEGRLVLADVLTFAVDEGAQKIIDLATLTGACVVALGEEVTGMFPNNEQMAHELTKASASVGEYVWPMPMHEHFEPLLKSSVADCKNVGPRWGGAVTAAKFLQKFVADTKWVHLDIAGPSWTDSSKAWCDAGSTADPLRTLVGWLQIQSNNTSV